MFARKHIIAIMAAFALSACVTNAGMNPYNAAGAGAYVAPALENGTGNIHVISGGELHW